MHQAREFEAMGVDGILAIMDTYFPLTQQEVYSYFRSIADSVSCPVVIYTNPTFQKTDLSIDLIRDLAKVPNIQYLKDASGNTGKLLTIANSLGDDIKLFSSSASIPLFVMMIGGVGWMAGPACVVPEKSVALYELALERKWDEAIALQKKLWQLNYVFQKYNLASCIKAALEIQGFPVGDPILPIQPVGEEALTHIRSVLLELEAI
jgi:4-hydroxy-tetrahydrodipicolinate synthase